MPREVHIGSPAASAEVGVVVGGVRVPVVTGLAGGGDAVYLDPHSHAHPTEALDRVRSAFRIPLLVECRTAADCALTATYAGGLVVDAGRLEDASLLEVLAQRGLPVVVRREAGAALDRWLEAADRCAAAGTGAVMLCEGGGEVAAVGASKGPIADRIAQVAAPDLSLLQRVRQCSDAPVLVDVSAAGELVGAAVAAGADGIVDPHGTVEQAGWAVELAATLAPFGRLVHPETVGAARQAIDQVDACLANLLERRTALAALVQRLKPVGGFAGRDREREQELVTAMARRAPRLGLTRVRTIMEVVIEAGLDLAGSADPTATSTPSGAAPDGEPEGEPGRAAAARPARSGGPSGDRSVADRDTPRAS